MTWDQKYRRLEEGEIILPTDQVQEDDGSWRMTIAFGKPAPDPSYTSHRVYRRLRRSASGYAVCNKKTGFIDIQTVAKTEVGAKVNGLLTIFELVLPDCLDEVVNHMWKTSAEDSEWEIREVEVSCV